MSAHLKHGEIGGLVEHFLSTKEALLSAFPVVDREQLDFTELLDFVRGPDDLETSHFRSCEPCMQLYAKEIERRAFELADEGANNIALRAYRKVNNMPDPGPNKTTVPNDFLEHKRRLDFLGLLGQIG